MEGHTIDNFLHSDQINLDRISFFDLNCFFWLTIANFPSDNEFAKGFITN